MSTSRRAVFKAESNNLENPNKNICALHVARAFGVADKVRYLHCTYDVVRALRTEYKVRSCKSEFGVQKGLTVGGLRKKMKKGDVLLVTVKDHILAYVWTPDRFIEIDTAPNNRAKITCLYRISGK